MEEKRIRNRKFKRTAIVVGATTGMVALGATAPFVAIGTTAAVLWTVPSLIWAREAAKEEELNKSLTYTNKRNNY